MRLVWVLRSLQWILAVIGLAALAVGLLLAAPLRPPPELPSIRAGAQAVDESGMPAVSRLQARDGTFLAYRLYQGVGTQDAAHSTAQDIALVIHGSAGHSVGMNQIARHLAAENLTVVAPDIRGHGGSGTRGDIAYDGQVDDDFEDILAELRRQRPQARFSLLGFSLGGGYALRLAAGRLAGGFDRLVLISPFLGPNAPSSRKAESSAQWASVDMPRIMALSFLRQLGVACCEALPVVAYAVAPNARKYVTPEYSYRLLANLSAPRDFGGALRRLKMPTTIIAGDADELMQSDKYAEIVQGIEPAIDVNVLPGLGHMDMLHVPAALAAIGAAMRPE